MNNALDNFIKGPLTSLLGLALMLASCYGWWIDYLTDWQAGGAAMIGFALLFMRDKLPEFITTFFKAIIDKFFGGPKPPVAPLLALLLISAQSFAQLTDVQLSTNNTDEIKKKVYNPNRMYTMVQQLIDSKTSKLLPPVTYTSNHTLELTDLDRMIIVNTTLGNVTITIPTNVSVAYQIGTQLPFLHVDSNIIPNTLTFAASGGVTLTASNSSLTSPLSQAGSIFLYVFKETTNGWHLANGTGTAPYVPLSGTAALTGNVELTGAYKLGLSNSSSAIGIGLPPGSITANTSFEIVSGNDTHAIMRNSSTPANNLQFGVISGTQPQILWTVGSNNTKIYQAAGTLRTETTGSLLYYGTSTTFQNVGATYSYVFSPSANVDNASRPFYLNTPGTSTSAATQAMDTDLYFRGRFYNGSANVTRGFYFHPSASTSNNLQGTLKLFTDIATGSGTEIMRFDQAGNTNIATNLNVGSTTITNSKAVLEVTSTTKGFLPPRMTTAEKNAISSPPEGLVVYDTTLHKLCVYTGSAWETITSI